MTLTLSIAVGVAYALFKFLELKKRNDKLKEIDLSKFTKVSLIKSYIPALAILFILAIVALLCGIVGKFKYFTGLGIILLAMSGVETYCAIQMIVFYYNNERCIIDDKMVPYKNIKSATKNRIPFVPASVRLFTGETKKVYPNAVDYINEHIAK